MFSVLRGIAVVTFRPSGRSFIAREALEVGILWGPWRKREKTTEMAVKVR